MRNVDCHSKEAGKSGEVALVHDWLTGMRGGEKVLQALCKLYPRAPIWTLLYVKGSVSETISNRDIKPSFLQRLPASAKKYRTYLPLFPILAESHRAVAKNLVISTSHAVAKSMVQRPSSRRPYHICYIHTPMRYAWDLYEEYFGVARQGWLLSNLIFSPIMALIRKYDFITASRVDLFVANSSYVAERVYRIYGRSAIVLPPPVEINRFVDLDRSPEEWYLVVSALVPYKRIEQAIEACAMLGRKLKIIGSGPEFDALAVQASTHGDSIQMLGAVSDECIAEHYRRAKALLFPGIEDFGIVPVEAIAAGCPVIAFGKGGILDSMNSDTAVFYYEQSVSALAHGIQNFEKEAHEFDVGKMRSRARSFSEESFIARFAEIVAHHAEQKN